MSNEEHVKIIKQGMNIWNKRRENNPDISPDLSRTNLAEANFRDADPTLSNL
jgi:hypothetical protein